MARRPTRRRPRRRILRCPSCGSTQIGVIAGMITGQVYYCRNCNYQGALVFEEDVPDEPKPLA
jgi:transcription elongation factor Elf1